VVFLRLISDSIKFAFASLINNKLRTFLSLLGVTIGIFSIISVMTTIDSLERSIRDNVSSLGNNTLYIQKWPWSFSNDYPWWKYIQRPLPKMEEADMIKERSRYSEDVAYIASTNKTVEFEDNAVENAGIMFASYDYGKIRDFDIAKGRYFNEMESHSGRNVAIVGSLISEELYQGANPIDKTIKINGHKLIVIGVFQQQGQDMFNYAYTLLQKYKTGCCITCC
jgi:putative ABC transport system permease protein